MGRLVTNIVLLGIILIFSLLIQGICAAEENNGTNTNLNNTTDGMRNDAQSSSWIILLPVFFGSLLFLCWICRYFDGMNLNFVLFMALLLCEILLLLLLNTALSFNLITDRQILKIIFIFGTIAIIIFVFRLYLYIKNDNKKVNDFLYKMRGINIIGTVLIWPIIQIYFYINQVQYFIFNGNKELAFPVYIITASYIGVVSYLLLSIEETFSHLVPEYKRLSIVWSYLRRIFIAPFIAIIVFYLLDYLQSGSDSKQNINDRFIFVFSFFVGVFTKTIEYWIYGWVQKILPGDKKTEFDSRDHYGVKESPFITILGLDEDVAYRLYHVNIKTIDDLASSLPERLRDKLNRDNLDETPGSTCQITSKCYSLEQVTIYINKAKDYKRINESELIRELKMDEGLARKISYIGIDSIKKLSMSDAKDLHEKLLKEIGEDVSENIINGYIQDAMKYIKEHSNDN